MKTSLLILVVVIVAALAVGAYWAVGSMKQSPGSTPVASTTVAAAPNRPYTTVSASTPSTSTVPTTGGASSGNSTYAVKIAYNSTVGNYLAGGTGLTLYMFDVDTPYSNASACNSGCDGTWLPFYNSTLTLAPGLNSSSFSTITRGDGSKQLTYKGYPLYRYVHDTQPGQIGGEGKGGVWYAYVV